MHLKLSWRGVAYKSPGRPSASVAGGRLPASHEIQDRNAKIGQPLLADAPAAEQSGSLTGKENACYGPNAAICLETRKFPDSIHHADWPSVRLDPGETYRHVMVHRFTR